MVDLVAATQSMPMVCRTSMIEATCSCTSSLTTFSGSSSDGELDEELLDEDDELESEQLSSSGAWGASALGMRPEASAPLSPSAGGLQLRRVLPSLELMALISFGSLASHMAS